MMTHFRHSSRSAAMTIVMTTLGSMVPTAASSQTTSATESVIQRAWQNPDANKGPNQTSPGYSRIDYLADRIMRITTREAMNTTIRFPADEIIEDMYVSDPIAFEAIIPRSNVILVRAIRPGADGNITAFGRSGNLYQFYVRSEGTNSPRITDLMVDVMVRGSPHRGVGSAAVYNASGAPRNSSAADLAVEADWLRRIGFRPENIVHDLSIMIPEGDSAGVVPERVFRDHQFTYIDYGANADSLNEWPIATLIVQGVETPVNVRTAGPNGRMLVVEGVGDIVLRNGRKIVCIKRNTTPALPAPPVRPPVRATMNVTAAAAAGELQVTPAGTTIPPSVTSPSNQRRYMIELGTGSPAELEKTWQTLKASYNSQLTNAAPSYTTVGNSSQLRAGPFYGLQSAVLACRAINAGGRPCAVVSE